MAAEMDITHARVVAPAGVKSVLVVHQSLHVTASGMRITSIPIHNLQFHWLKGQSLFADPNLQSYPLAIHTALWAACSRRRQITSHALRESREPWSM